MMLRVLKRNGKLEDVQFEKVTKRIKYLCEGVLRDGTVIGEPLSICYTTIAQDVISKIQDKISTSELDEFAARFCAALTKEDYQYGILGGRIAVSNHQKNTLCSYAETTRLIYENKMEDGTSYPLIDRSVYKFVMRYRKALDDMIVHTRDYNLDYFGFKTLEKGYLLRRRDCPVNVAETPQHLFMREAVRLCMNREPDGTESCLAAIKETYDILSQGYYVHASPTMYNIGTHFEQLASCFLLGVCDSVDEVGGIPDLWKACAQISKRSGGIGIGLQPIRARGTEIGSSGGQSRGLMPLLRNLNECATYFDQGSRRPGAFAVYISLWHPDIITFLDAKKATGLENERARDLFYGLMINDIFMERVEQAITSKGKVLWSVMCPHKCKGLYKVYGADFKALYEKYEAEGKFVKQYDIMTLWRHILDAQKETGTPYMIFADHLNRKNNQKNLGVIRNSNLCAEIAEYSDEKEYAVCNLASVALCSFVERDAETGKASYNFKRLHEVCKIAHRNLDTIIDLNCYPVPQARLSNMRHRPVGLGVQGFADTLALMDLAFEVTVNEEDHITRPCAEALHLNTRIAETMYHACIEASIDIAQAREPGMKVLKEAYDAGLFRFTEDGLDTVSTPELSQTCRDLIERLHPIRDELTRSTHLGAYSSFLGSPSSEGLLQYDLWDVTPLPTSESGLDWVGLKERLARYGLRNSLVRANMPTASTSQILGNAEAMEPYKYCIYTRRVTAGEFVVVNKHLHMELARKGLWTEDLKAQIIMNRGSILNIKSLPLSLRDKYRTAFEISTKTRQEFEQKHNAFLCQTSSFNVFVSEPNNKILTNIHMGAWKRGLKTGMYYLRREPVEHPVQYSSKEGLVVSKVEKEPKGGPADCVSCSA